MSDELSDRQLKWGYWWVRHRGAVRRAGGGGFSLIALVLCGYALWQVTDWLANRQAEEEALAQIVNRELNIEAYRMTNAPLALEIGTVTAVPTSRGLYDLVAAVKNPNIKWAISELPFTFTADGQTAVGSAYFLPLEEKYLVKLGVPLRVKPRKVVLILKKIGWQIINHGGVLLFPFFNKSEKEVEQVPPFDAGAPSGTR